ncbi:MAG: aspartyl protease family protein [Phycisphaerae bacterium]
MRLSPFVAVLCVCVPMALAQEGATSRRGYAASSLPADKVEMRFIRWGDAILVEDVMVNGKGPYRFLLDTGAEGAGRVDTTLVDALKLPGAGTSDSVGPLGQERQMNRYRLDTLSIGKLAFTGLVMSGRDYNAEFKSPGLRPIHGILGFHLFSEYLLTIDYPARKITIAKGELPKPDGKHIVPLVSDDEDPEIEIRLGEQTITALLDTGAQGYVLVPGSLAEKLKFAAAPVVRGRENGSELRSATLDGSLRIGEFDFPKPELMIADRLNQVIIGVRMLSSLSVTYDQKNDRARFDRPVAPKRFGMGVSWRGSGPWQLAAVDAGSIAETAGLRLTDSIVTIDGRPFAELDREDMFKLLDASTITVEIERDGVRQKLRLSRE